MKAPHLFSIGNKTKIRRGVVVGHNNWRITWKNELSLLLFEFSKLPKQKIFQKVKLYYRKIKYIIFLLVNDILFQLFSTLIICRLKLVLVFTSVITWLVKIKQSLLCKPVLNMLICRR